MSAYGITSDIAIITKPRKDSIVMNPKGQYIGIELSDDKLNKLFSIYCGLLLMQYEENKAASKTESIN